MAPSVTTAAPARTPVEALLPRLLPQLLTTPELDLGAVDVALLMKALQGKRRPIPTLEAYVVDSWLPSKLPTLKKSTRDHYAWVFDA